MKKRSLSLGGRPGPLSHVSPSLFSRRNSIPGCDIAPTQIESAKSDAHLEYGSQQESQSKHPFLSRSGHPYSSQSQRSLSQTCLTQSQSTQRFSQNSQAEEYGCEQWKKGLQDKEISLSQPKRPSPYFSGLTSSFNRRNVSGNVGGGSTPASPTCTSAPLCLVGPQNGTPRPWPQCNISEELEKRLCSLEKLREQETALLQKICDDYQQIKIFLEETCFESKDNRSKLLLQQNALHKLVKEEETANSSILAAIKAAEEVVMQDIKNLKQVAEGDAANKSIVTTSLKFMAESIREEIASLKKDLKAELQAGKQSVPIDNVHMAELIREDIASLKKDLNAELQAGKQSVPIDNVHMAELIREDIASLKKDLNTELQSGKQSVPIDNVYHDLSNPTSHIRTDVTETADKHSPGIPISMPEVVDLDEVPDSCLDAGLDFEFLEGDDACPASNTRSKVRVPNSNRLDEQCTCTDDDIRRSIRRKMRRRAQKRIRGKYVLEKYP